MTSPTALLEIAHEALDIGRRRLLEQDPQQVSAKSERDLVSDLDFAVERELRRYLEARTPGVNFLGEEDGWAHAPGSTYWTLDPIDGTSNFVRHIPLCGISLALVQDGCTTLGLIDLPFLGARYSAALGQGAFKDGQAIRASATNALSEAIVGIGDYAVGKDSEQRNAPRLAVTRELAASVQRVRMFGSAAVDLAWVAEGRTDASIILSNKTWDTAAGVLIAREAGARVMDLNGAEHSLQSSATITVAAPLAEALLGLLSRACGSVGG